MKTNDFTVGSMILHW